jgi:plastocyanin
MSRHRALHQRLVAAVGIGAVVLSGACSSSGAKVGPATKAGATVSTGLLAFAPKTVSIHTGQTVTWIGGDNIRHVLVEGSYQVGSDGLRTKESDDKAFHLELSRKGQQVSHTYDRPGTFTYFCTIHHGMNGTVTVS